MNKTIEKAEAKRREIVEKRLNKLTVEYNEARASFNDFAYNRYQKKMDRCKEEMYELEEYLNKDEYMAQRESELRNRQMELEHMKNNISNKLFYLLKSIPDCSEARGIKEYLDNLNIL